MASLLTSRVVYKPHMHSSVSVLGGLSTDANIVSGVLEAAGFINTVVSIYDAKNLSRVNVQIFIEHVPNPTLIDFPADNSFVLVNHEWITDWDLSVIKSGKAKALFKTHQATKALKTMFSGTYIGFGNNTSVFTTVFAEMNKKSFAAVNTGDVKKNGLAIHLAGTSPYKGTLSAMIAYYSLIFDKKYPLRPDSLFLICTVDMAGKNRELIDSWNAMKAEYYKSNPIIKKDFASHFYDECFVDDLPAIDQIGSMYLCTEPLLSGVKERLQTLAAVHVCPSMVEGWGHYIDEGRRTGAVVITLDAAPMNELIDASCGVLVPARPGPAARTYLSKGWTKNFPADFNPSTVIPRTIADLAQAISKALLLPTERSAEIGAAAIARSQKDFVTFKDNFTKLLDGLMVPISQVTPKDSEVGEKKTARIVYRTWGIAFKGITLDILLLKMALKDFEVETFEVKVKAKEMEPLTKRVDIQVFIEHVEAGLGHDQIFPAHNHFLLVNHEFLTDWDMQQLIPAQIGPRRSHVIAKKYQDVTALCKTQIAMKLLEDKNLTCRYTGFGNARTLNCGFIDKKNFVLHMAGSSSFKNTWLLIDAWNKYVDPELANERANEQPPILIVTMMVNTGMMVNVLRTVARNWEALRPEPAELPSWLEVGKLTFPPFTKHGNIYVCQEFIDNDESKNWLQEKAMCHACPSAVEGWGHYIDEGRRMGTVVVTLDGAPMNELIDDSCGVLVPAVRGPPMNQSDARYTPVNYDPPTFIPRTQKDLGDKLLEVIAMPDEVRFKLGQEARKKSEAQRAEAIENLTRVFNETR